MSSKKKSADPKNEKSGGKDTASETSSELELSQEEKLQKELEEKQNQLLSLAAEYDNFRKRSLKERECIYSDVRSSVLKELLPIVDNMERALTGDDTDAAGYKKGVEMTFAGLMNLLEKAGVECYGSEGDDFDPAFYHAVMHVEDTGAGEQKVVEVFQKGYRHGDKILREAMVKVAN